MSKDVEALMTKAFSTPRDPRSEEYKAGIRSALEYRLHGIKMECPYKGGTAQCDAYLSGTDEGHRRWRELQEEEAAPVEERGTMHYDRSTRSSHYISKSAPVRSL